MMRKFLGDTAQKKINGTYKLFILVLAAASLIWIVLLVVAPFPEPFLKIIRLFDGGICFIFVFDFFRSLFIAIDKGSFLKWGWLDLISSIPYLFIFRFLRIARIIRASHNLRMVKSQEVVQRISRRRDETTLLGTALIAIFVVLFSSLIIFRIESKAPTGNIVSGVDALWWAIVTISTVGYGDIYPITNPGRVVATLVIIVGVALFSVFTSYLASTFLTQRTREQEQALKEIKVDLGEIKELLKNNNRIEALINQKEIVSPPSKNAVVQSDSRVNEE